MTEKLFNPFDFEDAESTVVVIRNPLTGEPTGATVTVMGPTHPSRRQLDFAIASRDAKRMFEMMRKGRHAEQVDPEEEDKRVTERLVKYTVGWSGFASDDGRPLEFTPGAANKLYSAPQLCWLRDQIKEVADDRERFIKRSAANS